MTHVILPINAQSGIQKDSTLFESAAYTDGQWCRFYQGKPRKMGGYKLITAGGPTITRSMFVVPKPDNSIDVYMGRPADSDGLNGGLFVVNIDTQGNSSAEYERTPVGFVPTEDDQWDFDLFTGTNTGSTVSNIIAHVAQNINNINSDIVGEIFYGDILLTTPLVTTGMSVSGGIVTVPPYLFAFGSDGVVYWSAPNDPTDWDTSARFAAIAGTKIIEGYRTRGGGAPAVLFWSLNSLVRMIYTGGTTGDEFQSDTITDKVSILSKDSIAQVDQVFYWPGLDRKFYLYNGTVQEFVNNYNKNYFYDNINLTQRNKAWGIYISTFNEIWFFAPFDQEEECNHMIGASLTEGSWFNSELTRSCGYPIDLFQYPILAASTPIADISSPGSPDAYGIWLHEYGYDKYQFNTITAIPSYFTTPLIALANLDPNQDQDIQVQRIAPDFTQIGDMSVVINKRKYPRSTPTESPVYNFSPTTIRVDTRGIGGIISFTFTSNTGGGFYQMGKVWLEIAAMGSRRSK